MCFSLNYQPSILFTLYARTLCTKVKKIAFENFFYTRFKHLEKRFVYVENATNYNPLYKEKFFVCY